MKKHEEISISTKYCRDKILAHKELFTQCTLDQLDVVLGKSSISKEKNELLSNAIIDDKLLKKEKKVLTEDSYVLYDLGYRTLGATHKDLVKVYYKVSPTKTKKVLEKVRKGLQNVVVIMKSDDRNELEFLLSKYQAKIIEIDEFLTRNEEFISKKDIIDSDFASASISWEKSYKKLKDYVKGDLQEVETDKDYKYFFYEYSKLASKPSHKKVEDKTEEPKAEPNKSETPENKPEL